MAPVIHAASKSQPGAGRSIHEASTYPRGLRTGEPHAVAVGEGVLTHARALGAGIPTNRAPG
jgi:hypothetical protein